MKKIGPQLLVLSVVVAGSLMTTAQQGSQATSSIPEIPPITQEIVKPGTSCVELRNNRHEGALTWQL